ncbi:transposable element Tcb1 transposase [Trichonephila clavipes]|nr:transposable element Tcb1 transposase [Trichonephila clavipes]
MSTISSSAIVFFLWFFSKNDQKCLVENSDQLLIKYRVQHRKDSGLPKLGIILHHPQCTTSRDDRHLVRMTVTHLPVTSRTIAQHIESATHHSVFACTIRRRLQQSGLSKRSPLLGLPFTQNHGRLRHQ